jgi:hypothetical protein
MYPSYKNIENSFLFIFSKHEGNHKFKPFRFKEGVPRATAVTPQVFGFHYCTCISLA